MRHIVVSVVLVASLMFSAACDLQAVEGDEDPSWVDDLSEEQLAVTQPYPDWMGNYVVKLTRESGHPCAGGSAVPGTVVYGSWERERAVIRNLCFEVWEPGVTDWNNPDIWRQLDTRVYHRFGSSPYTFDYVNMVDRTGNNARYGIDLSTYDPYRTTSCSSYVQKTMQLYFWVNGRKSPTFKVRYEACT